MNLLNFIAQSPETLIIAGNKFNLSVNLLPDFLAANNVKLKDGKSYIAVWELRDNFLYLNDFSAYVEGKSVTFNDLFPDLFSIPSPVKARWFTGRIEVVLKKMGNLSDYIVIQSDKGSVANIFHKQIVRNNTNNEVLSDILKKISQKRLGELIYFFQKIDGFDSDIYCYMAEGLDDNEVIKKVLSKHLYYDELDSITIRLLEIMRGYPKYFMPLLYFYYPFTKEMLKENLKFLCWHCLSENFFLDWDEDLLMEFKDKWNWFYISENILGIRGKLASFDFLLKYYEMGLIDAEDILRNRIMNKADYDYDYAFSNMKSFYEEFKEISQLVSKNEALKKEVEELVKERIEKEHEMEEENIFRESLEPRNKTPEKIGSIMREVINEFEEARYNIYQNQPKELEEIISFLERKGNILDEKEYVWRQLECNKIPDPFLFDNPLKNGVDYTFNTSEKKKVLDDAVKAFFNEQTIRFQIREKINLIRNKELILSWQPF